MFGDRLGKVGFTTIKNAVERVGPSRGTSKHYLKAKRLETRCTFEEPRSFWVS